MVQLPAPLGPAESKAELLLPYSDFINHTERIKIMKPFFCAFMVISFQSFYCRCRQSISSVAAVVWLEGQSKESKGPETNDAVIQLQLLIV